MSGQPTAAEPAAQVLAPVKGHYLAKSWTPPAPPSGKAPLLFAPSQNNVIPTHAQVLQAGAGTTYAEDDVLIFEDGKEIPLYHDGQRFLIIKEDHVFAVLRKSS